MLRQFGTFLAWFSGSLAGVSALLYGLGFVATMAEDQLLGIGFAVATRDPAFYVARGGSLVMRTLIFAIWPVLGFVVLAAMLRAAHARLGTAHRGWLEGARRVGRAGVAPLAAIAMLSLALLGLERLIMPGLEIDGLLFVNAIPADSCDGGDPLKRAIFMQDHAELGDQFMLVSLWAGVVLGLGVIAWPQVILEGNTLWLVVAGIAVFLTIVGVPVAYGIMGARIAAPSVQIEPMPGDNPGRIRLLSRSENGALVWLEEQQLVRWISARKIDTLTVGPGEPLLRLSCAAAGVRAEGDKR